MPYTPPSRSPTTSHQASPSQTSGVRPQLPRSNSSTSYLQRHRRSPSAPVSHSDYSKSPTYTYDAGHGSVRQSPQAMTNGTMPMGAIISPPDSSQNSSDDETSTRGNREVEGLEELQEAVRRSLNIEDKTGSPQNETMQCSGKPQLNLDMSRGGDFMPLEQTPLTPPRLSASARKISHSRSATDSAIVDIQHFNGSVVPSDDSEDDFSGSKPPLLRKKSGELVKPAIRPRSRRKHSSMPGTPTYSKAVHFNDDIEQVRHFLQVDRPIAVSAGASPVEGYEEESEFPFGLQSQRDGPWALYLKNFPRDSLERMSRPVRVERLYMSSDQKNLIGVVAVANLAFHKQVTARFTLDYWKTTSEVTAEFSNDTHRNSRADSYDQFNFSIKLSDQANLEARTLLLCVRYNVGGQEYWDNNDDTNYQVDFVKKVPTIQATKEPSSSSNHITTGLRERAVPRSRHHSSSASRPRSGPSFEDDFSNGLDQTSVRFKNPSSKPAVFRDMPPPRRRAGVRPHFSTRYDFGASLSAALSQAQAQLGERSGLSEMRRDVLSASNTFETTPPASNLSPRTSIAVPAASEADTPRPDALLANRQSLDSRAYQEFVSKFCFFGSSKSQNQNQRMNDLPFDRMDGTQEEDDPRLIGVSKTDPSRVVSRVGELWIDAPLPCHDASGQSSPNLKSSNGLSIGCFNRDDHSGIITSQSQTPTAIHG